MNVDPRSDVALLDASRAGDGRAFAALFDRHYQRVFSHAQKFTEVRADAEDVAAVAFMEMWRKQSQVRIVDDSVLPWLLVTTTNVSRNLRRASYRYRAALDALTHEEPAREPTTSSASLRDALKQLTAVDQQLIALTLDGFSTSEAAAAAGISGGAARVRLTRARHRLQRLLQNTSTTSHVPSLQTEE